MILRLEAIIYAHIYCWIILYVVSVINSVAAYKRGSHLSCYFIVLSNCKKELFCDDDSYSSVDGDDHDDYCDDYHVIMMNCCMCDKIK